MVIKTNRYLTQCEDVWEQLIVSESKVGEGSKATYVLKLKASLPTYEGLSMYLGVARSTIALWGTTHKEFSDSLEMLLTQQKQQLILMGLSGAYNSKIASLMLSNNHGLNTKVDHDVQQEIHITLTEQDMRL